MKMEVMDIDVWNKLIEIAKNNNLKYSKHSAPSKLPTYFWTRQESFLGHIFIMDEFMFYELCNNNGLIN